MIQNSGHYKTGLLWVVITFNIRLQIMSWRKYAILTSFSSWLLLCSEVIKFIAGHHISPSFQKLPCMWRHILCCRFQQNIMLVEHFENHLWIWRHNFRSAWRLPCIKQYGCHGHDVDVYIMSSKQYKQGNSFAWRRTH